MSLLGALKQIVGGYAGVDAPPREPPPLPALDAREHALEAFADFVSELVFAQPDSLIHPTFSIPRNQVLTHQPPDPQLLVFPSVAIVPVRGTHDSCSLGGFDVLDETLDVFERGTAVVRLGEYSEPLTVEAWAEHDPQRTSILAGIEIAFRLSERTGAILLRLPKYFGTTARFTLTQSEHIDDPDVVRGRIRAHLYLSMDVPELQLVDAVTFRPRFRSTYSLPGE